MAKTLYHSALVKLGAVKVTVKSDVLASKYSKPNAPKPNYVVLDIGGEDFNYSFDTPACEAAFTGCKGKTFMIVAEGSGKDGSATVTYVGEPVTAAGPAKKKGMTPHNTAVPPNNPAYRQAGPPAGAPARTQAPAQSSATNPTQPGVRVGMAMNLSVKYGIATGELWNPQAIMERASDLIRLSASLEAGHLCPKFSERQQQQQQD